MLSRNTGLPQHSPLRDVRRHCVQASSFVNVGVLRWEIRSLRSPSGVRMPSAIAHTVVSVALDLNLVVLAETNFKLHDCQPTGQSTLGEALSRQLNVC